MTLREFILAGSSLPTGNTIRGHLNNQSTGGSGATFPVYQFEVDHKTTSMEVDLITTTLLVNHDKPTYSVEFIKNGSTVDLNVTPVATSL